MKKISTYSLAVLIALFTISPLFALAQYGGGGGGASGAVGTSRRATQRPVPEVLGQTRHVFIFTLDLSLGASSTEVTELQKVLIAKGFLKIDAPTGYFGPLTEAALKAFQSANGLEPVGVVGPLTRAVLNTPAPVVATEEQRKTLISAILKQIAELRSRITAMAALSASL